MPNNKVKTFKQMQGKGKDKMHPSSRKGLQMERVMLRQEKLKQANRRVYTAKENKSGCILDYFMSLSHFADLIDAAH